MYILYSVLSFLPNMFLILDGYRVPKIAFV